MNPSDPLAQLRDIHLPEAVSWWPLAPGWWVLGALLVAGLAYTGHFLWQRHHAFTYRRQALQKIKQLPSNSQHQRITDLFVLLKRGAVRKFSFREFCCTFQAEFIAFLNQTTPKAGFDQLPTDWQRLFYAKDSEVSVELVDQLVASGTQWIKRHPLAKNLGDTAHA